ncbi:hypothetical protein PT282_05010 [Bifidobacterium sp. ESL0763]|uniref:hypothetical protein n=1 Tax=Bifidobacterium sp. ESL0763 TaxID=2983227 RepID=UPI0023F62954|nr:hypothetical protein [Bifidobacterium sp. ESL0763]MDF7664021.1 hypothetical protein [Bifidobacterium sp. ESL0763]
MIYAVWRHTPVAGLPLTGGQWVILAGLLLAVMGCAGAAVASRSHVGRHIKS